MKLTFSKYQGTGNDFILIDNRNGDSVLTNNQIEKLCHRRFGIGADGLIVLEKAEGFDFRMIYFNADGKEGSMCGNGGRCIVKFAHDAGIVNNEYRFIAIDGPHDASLEMDGKVRLKMKDVEKIESHSNFDFVDTGSPHVVKQINSVEYFDVLNEGRAIRNSPSFKEKGVNVNFVEVLKDDRIYVRTYERGVEDETYSCGTGVTASALVHAHNERGFNHVDVETIGGTLYVEFEKTGDISFQNIWLAGPATKVFSGEILL
jgi:diaminopimelate epimerase